MCLSAPVSFTLSAALIVTSCFLLTKARSKKLWPLAFIPLFFGMQQASEGVVWLKIPSLQEDAKNVFLFFAYSFWPFWVPLSLWFAEPKSSQKQGLSFLVGTGFTIAVFLLALIPSTEALFYTFSIHYKQESSLETFSGLGMFFYVLSTIGPLFISSLRFSKLFGLIIFMIALFLFLIDRYTFVSLWCFFAAALSPLIFLLIRKQGAKNL